MMSTMNPSIGTTPQGISPAETLPVRRATKILKLLAYMALFLAALFFFVAWKLPDSLVSNLLLNSLNSNTAYRWQAEKISTSFFFVPHVQADKMSFQGKAPGSWGPFVIDSLKVYPTLWTLLPLTGSLSPKVSFSGRAYQADMSGAVRSGKNFDLSLNASGVDFAKIQPLQDAGVDLKGLFTKIVADVAMANNDPSQADGTFEIQGKNFVIDPAAFALPLPLPIMDVGTIELRGRIQNGKLEFQRANAGSPGKDIELKISGDIQLKQNIALSPTNLRLLLKPSAKVLASMPSLKPMLTTLSATLPDGFYAMRFTGPLGNLGLPRPDTGK